MNINFYLLIFWDFVYIAFALIIIVPQQSLIPTYAMFHERGRLKRCEKCYYKHKGNGNERSDNRPM